jgi:hypothetical protein
LRLSAIPDLYSAIAQSAAAKAASFADFLEEILRIDDIGYLPLARAGQSVLPGGVRLNL